MSSNGTLTLQPGAPAQSLTTSAGSADEPLTIINDSADRAYVGTDYSVGPNNATPIDGFTSVNWTTPGEVWAIADGAAAAPVTLRATTDVAGWDPSPIAIATATAARLLATGVPDVLVQDVLADQDLQDNGGTVTVAIDRYASVMVAITFLTRQIPGGPIVDDGPVSLDATQTIKVGSATVSLRTDVLTGQAALNVQKPTYRLSAEGTSLTLTNTGTTDCHVRVLGSNRPAPARVTMSSGGNGTGGVVSATVIENWGIASQNFALGNNVAFARTETGGVQPFSQGGECDLYAQLGTTATGNVTAASVGLFDAAGNSFPFLDTKSPDAYADSVNRLIVARRQYIPPGAKFTYIPRTAGTAAPILRLIFRP